MAGFQRVGGLEKCDFQFVDNFLGRIFFENVSLKL